MQGIIVKAISGFYYVKTPNGIFECKARGSFRKSGITPLCGDNAEITVLDNSHGTVEKILNRKNFLYRPPIANVDKAFIVSSYETPAPNALILDTFTTICEYKNITPILIFNKSDLGDFSEWVNCYNQVGYKTIVCSAKDGSGLSEIRNELKNSVSVFTGNSGVGKSSLLNCLFGNLDLKTGAVSEKLGRGRHTTRHVELFEFSEGFVADTPGFSEIELDADDYGIKEQLPNCFVEFSDFLQSCKFTGCSHTGEKGCAVCAAAASGLIPASRLNSYKMLFNELKGLKEWQISKK